MSTPTIEQLQRAIKITEQIDKLEAELKAVLGGGGSKAPAAPVKTASAPKPTKKKRTMSPEARERIAAAQRARWAKVKGAKAPAPTAEKAAPASSPAKKPAAKAKVTKPKKAKK